MPGSGKSTICRYVSERSLRSGLKVICAEHDSRKHDSDAGRHRRYGAYLLDESAGVTRFVLHFVLYSIACRADIRFAFLKLKESVFRFLYTKEVARDFSLDGCLLNEWLVQWASAIGIFGHNRPILLPAKVLDAAVYLAPRKFVFCRVSPAVAADRVIARKATSRFDRMDESRLRSTLAESYDYFERIAEHIRAVTGDILFVDSHLPVEQAGESVVDFMGFGRPEESLKGSDAVPRGRVPNPSGHNEHTGIIGGGS